MERSRILQAVKLLSKHTNLEAAKQVSELSSAGFSTIEAHLLVALVPTAFGWTALEKFGITDFAPSISAPTRAGGRVDIPLKELPLFDEALALAREHCRSGILDHEEYKRITNRSAEVNALSRALNEGADVKGAAIASALVWPCAEDLGYEPRPAESWLKRFFGR